MALRIDTFDNLRGGNTLYKALTHPHAAPLAHALLETLAWSGPVAIVDGQSAAGGFAEIYGLDRVEIAGIFVQDIAQIGREVLGHTARPLTDLADTRARAVLVAGFDT